MKKNYRKTDTILHEKVRLILTTEMVTGRKSDCVFQKHEEWSLLGQVAPAPLTLRYNGDMVSCTLEGVKSLAEAESDTVRLLSEPKFHVSDYTLQCQM
jgi:hypothetical protein